MGYHSLWTGAGYLNNDFHAMLLLARAAAEAPDLELGMVSLLPLYHPVEAAEQVATLDVICGGRFVLAPALGWRDFQFNAFGVPKEERLSRFREVLEVMKKLWSQERVTHHGKHFHMDDVPGAGGLLQGPQPKMYIAANLDVGVARAAREGDGWLVSSRATLPTIERQTKLYREAAGKAGKVDFISAWREMFGPRPASRPWILCALTWNGFTGTGPPWGIAKNCQRRTASTFPSTRFWKGGSSLAAPPNA